MADMHDAERPRPAAEPPAGGRQDHDAMRAAARRPLEVSDDEEMAVMAAGGGLELPGRERQPSEVPATDHVPEPIPGERDASTLTTREPGAMGARISGEDVPSPDPRSWMDEATTHERELEGGGKR